MEHRDSEGEDQRLHEPVRRPLHRLRAARPKLALLSNVERADFAQIEAELGATDGDLGQHLRVLEDAGLVASSKEPSGGRSRTWVRITRRGRTALRGEIQALKEIVAIVESPVPRASRTAVAKPLRAAPE